MSAASDLPVLACGSEANWLGVGVFVLIVMVAYLTIHCIQMFDFIRDQHPDGKLAEDDY